MGDRAMAEIKTDGGSIFIYTHWGGFDLSKDAKEAIRKAMPRIQMNDLPYSTHIVIDQLIKGCRDSETGIGIMLNDNAEDEYNNNKPSVIIDLVNQTLQVIREDEEGTYLFNELCEY